MKNNSNFNFKKRYIELFHKVIIFLSFIALGWLIFVFFDYLFVLRNPFPDYVVNSTFKLGLPIYLKGNNNKAIFLIHGFSGSTYDFKDLSVKLNNKGYTVYAVRLPGHATT